MESAYNRNDSNTIRVVMDIAEHFHVKIDN
jgi:hypothetical protein